MKKNIAAIILIVGFCAVSFGTPSSQPNAFGSFTGKYNVSDIKIEAGKMKYCDRTSFSEMTQFEIQNSEFGPVAILTAPTIQEYNFLVNFEYRDTWGKNAGGRSKVEQIQNGAKRTSEEYTLLESQITSVEITQELNTIVLKISSKVLSKGVTTSECTSSAILSKQ